MINIEKIEAPETFIEMIKTGEPLIITNKEGKKIAYVLTPEALEDMLDGFLAEEAEKGGMLGVEETEKFLNSIRNA